MKTKIKFLIVIATALTLAFILANYFVKVEEKYEDPSKLKMDSLMYVNKVKDSIIYDLYQENKYLKQTN